MHSRFLIALLLGGLLLTKPQALAQAPDHAPLPDPPRHVEEPAPHARLAFQWRASARPPGPPTLASFPDLPALEQLRYEPAFLPISPTCIDRAGLARTGILSAPHALAEAVLRGLAADPRIAWCERLPNEAARLCAPAAMLPPTNDPLLSSQWALEQRSGIDMDVPAAWRLRGTPHVPSTLVVAVLDSGRESGAAHPDLAGTAWRNPGEIANGRDDDGNGLIDDLVGYDFFDDDGEPNAMSPHGVAVSGIIAGRADNGHGGAGIASGASVMHLKGFGAFGTAANRGRWANTVGLAAAMQYATQMGAHVINNSWSLPRQVRLVEVAIEFAHDNGVHVIFAAGNTGSSTVFPAMHPDVIAVGAIAPTGQRATWSGGLSSNHGEWVDLCAGGTGILAPALGGAMDPGFFGTSAACPLVTGVALLVLAESPHLTPDGLRELLRSTAAPLPHVGSGSHLALGSGHVNAHAALLELRAIQDLGSALDGSFAPRLAGFGGGETKAPFHLTLGGCDPAQRVLLALGAASRPSPLQGGIVIPRPDTLAWLDLRADGTTTLAFERLRIPPPGTQWFLQAAQLDAGAPQGLALSNALQLRW